jgi:hypothetical protein
VLNLADVLELVIERMIGEGIITESELKQRIEEEKAKSPFLPLAENINTLVEKTDGMQEIDFFTLDQTSTLDEKTIGMQQIDDYTLKMVMEMQTTIDGLNQRISTLEGGTAK